MITLALLPVLVGPVGDRGTADTLAVAATADVESPLATMIAGRHLDLVAVEYPEGFLEEVPTTTVLEMEAPAAAESEPTVRALAAAADPEPAPDLESEPAPRATTTTTSPPPPPPAAPAPEADPARTEDGKASWYDHIPGICAHRTLPFDTVVTVVHTRNGRSTTCVVGDRGPFIEGWIIDLNPQEFRQLAPLDDGVIPVRISW